jgi:hypothetical protein
MSDDSNREDSDQDGLANTLVVLNAEGEDSNAEQQT